ncbi:unnamed protein product [Closterium sp. NIES-54]
MATPRTDTPSASPTATSPTASTAATPTAASTTATRAPTPANSPTAATTSTAAPTTTPAVTSTTAATTTTTPATLALAAAALRTSRSSPDLKLWPRVSLPKTSPTLRWTGEVGDASVFWVWGSRAFVRDTSADKLSPHAIPCVFLGFPPDVPGWKFYHPTSRRVFPSRDVTFDESVPFYRLFPSPTPAALPCSSSPSGLSPSVLRSTPPF